MIQVRQSDHVLDDAQMRTEPSIVVRKEGRAVQSHMRIQIMTYGKARAVMGCHHYAIAACVLR